MTEYCQEITCSKEALQGHFTCLEHVALCHRCFHGIVDVSDEEHEEDYCYCPSCHLTRQHWDSASWQRVVGQKVEILELNHFAFEVQNIRNGTLYSFYIKCPKEREDGKGREDGEDGDEGKENRRSVLRRFIKTWQNREVRIALQGQVVARVSLQISRTSYPDVNNLVQLSFSMHLPQTPPLALAEGPSKTSKRALIHRILSVRVNEAGNRQRRTGLRVLEWEEQPHFPCEYEFVAQDLSYVESAGEIRILCLVWLYIDYQNDLHALAKQNDAEVTLILAGTRMRLTRARVCLEDFQKLKFLIQ